MYTQKQHFLINERLQKNGTILVKHELELVFEAEVTQGSIL